MNKIFTTTCTHAHSCIMYDVCMFIRTIPLTQHTTLTITDS